MAELDDAGSEARIRLAAPLSFASVERMHGERFAMAEEVRFDPREAVMIARRTVRLGALPIREQPLVADPALVAACLVRGDPQSGPPLDRRSPTAPGPRRPAPPPRPDGVARLVGGVPAGDLEEWLAPHLGTLRRLADLDGLDLRAILLDLLDHTQRRDLDRLAPTQLDLPSGRRARDRLCAGSARAGGQAAGAVRPEQHTD